MSEKGKFTEELKTEPFQSYDEYMDYIFACCNAALAGHIRELKRKYVAGQGGYKNVMYPDIEIASNLCEDKIQEFELSEYDGKQGGAEGGDVEELPLEIDAELMAMLQGFSQSLEESSDEEKYAMIGKDTGRQYTLGEKVWVMVKATDRISKTIDFILVQNMEE